MKNIAIVCGGNTGEYEISMESGKRVFENIDSEKYRPFLIEIKGIQWSLLSSDGKKYPVKKEDFSVTFNSETITFDAVFNAIHGSPGEDGKLQGYFDMLNIPYSSCGVDASVLTFNKYLCNIFVRSFDIKTATSFSFRKNEKLNKKTVIESLGFPLFIKPSRSGSSVGVSKVNNESEFDNAIQNAFAHDNRILIEKAVLGRELACGIATHKNKILVFPITEIKTNNTFFDYEAKYTHGKSEEITPALIPQETAEDIQTLSRFLYEKMDCKGFVRFDYILSDNEIFFLEVNSIPGMTAASILPQQARAYGLTEKELFTMAIDNLFS